HDRPTRHGLRLVHPAGVLPRFALRRLDHRHRPRQARRRAPCWHRQPTRSRRGRCRPHRGPGARCPWGSRPRTSLAQPPRHQDLSPLPPAAFATGAPVTTTNSFRGPPRRGPDRVALEESSSMTYSYTCTAPGCRITVEGLGYPRRHCHRCGGPVEPVEPASLLVAVNV